MALDRERLFAVFSAIGEALEEPATLCLIGSAPGILRGQPDRTSVDIDVWRKRSDFTSGSLEQACLAAGILFDPRGELDEDAVYLQLVTPGEVRLPAEFEVEPLGRFGRLSLVMPTPPLLTALKLSRASSRDLEDVAWWVKEFALSRSEMMAAIDHLPRQDHRETAEESLVFFDLLFKRKA